MKTISFKQIFGIKLFILTLGFILTANVTFSQDYEMTRINNRSSPEASGGKVGGAGSSVDMFRGTLNTSIPIHNYVGREMNLPISLSYSATGIKVDQVASNVGLGWNLNVGGRIAKVVSVSSDNSYTNNNNPELLDSPQQMCGRDPIDAEYPFEFPDFYRVTAMGFEDVIQYVQTHYNEMHSIINPYHQVSVTYPPNSTSNNMMPRESASFTIVNEKEEEYYFGGGNSEVTIINSSGSAGCQNINEKSTTSWLLTKVVSSNKLDVYEFEYQNFIWASGSDIENNGEGYDVGLLYHLLQTKYRMNQQMIKRIFHNGKKIIEFNYDNREDLVFEGGQGNRLTSIDFFNFNENSIYKRVTFSYSYFGNSASNSFLDKRLKLERVTFSGTALDNTTLVGDEYSFTYFMGQTPTEMPTITSYARDYLGLYNGRLDNINLVINGIENLPGGVYNVNPPNSQRSYKHEKAIIGTLESITNPTKGKTIFHYEQNALNGGYGTVSVQGATYEVENTLVNHVNDGSYCTSLPDQYTSINTAMNWPLDLYNFSGYNNTSSPHGSAINVQTTVLDLTNENNSTIYHFSISGNGVYMIQRIPSCNLPSHPYPDCQIDEEPIPVFDGCLVPTQNIFYNGQTSSHQEDFIAGGLAHYAPALQPRTLVPGKYQITTWFLSNEGNWNPPVIVKVYKMDQITPAPHDDTLDVTNNYIDGFRINSITNLDVNFNFVSKKAYKYKTGRIVDYVNNLKETNDGTSTGRQRLSRGYVNAPEIVHYYDVFEVDLDRDGHDNGYVEYKFNYDGTGQIVPFYYSNDPRYPANIGGYNYDKNDMLSEKLFFNKAGTLVFKEKYDYSPDYYLGHGSLDSYPRKYYKLIRIESTNYFNANSSITKVQTFDEYIDNRLYIKTSGIENFTYSYDDNSTTSSTFRIAGIDSNIKGDTRFIYSPRPGFMYTATTPISRRLLTEVQHSRHGDTPQPITQFEYDINGNKVQTTQYTTPGNPNAAGIESYIYGYDNRFLIAKISGIKYANIDTNLIHTIQLDSNKSVSELNDSNLRASLDLLRADFPNALITTYTYNPVYGVTSVTDPKGYTIFSEYDALGRLKYTKERKPNTTDQFNILSENQYHTITNP